jgi:hypothetical protein
MLCVLALGQRETDNNIRMITIRQADIKVNKVNCKSRSRGLVVKGEDSQLSGCGFESWYCILEGCK